MARWLVLAVITLLVGYGFFWANLAGQPLSSHLADIWRSPTVQQKVRMVEHSLPSLFSSKPPQRPAATRRPATARAVPAEPARKQWESEDLQDEHHGPSEADRRSLDALVHRVQKNPRAKAAPSNVPKQPVSKTNGTSADAKSRRN